MITEYQELRERWLKADGKPLPQDIFHQPLELIRKAVAWREKGIVACVSKPMTPTTVDESSLMDWDRQDDKNGNAYA